MKFKRILVGMDERVLARPAVEVGMRLAERFGAHLDVVHSTPLGNPTWAATTAIDWHAVRAEVLASTRQTSLERLYTWFPEGPPGDRSFEDLLVILEDKPSRALVEFAREHDVDLLVLGRHQRRGLIDLGGTIRSVFHHLPCPVWIQSTPAYEPRRILAPIDPVSVAPASLDWIRETAEQFAVPVTLLHAFEAPNFAYEPLHSTANPFPIDEVRAATSERFDQLLSELEWPDVDVEGRFLEGDPTHVILENQHPFDLIALSTHTRSVLGRAILGSVAHEVLTSAPCAVLARPVAADELLPSGKNHKEPASV